MSSQRSSPRRRVTARWPGAGLPTLLLLVPLGAGCASRVVVLQPGAAAPTRVVERGYEPGAPRLVPVGTTLARVKDYAVLRYPAAYGVAASDFTLRMGHQEVIVRAGQRCRMLGTARLRGRAHTVVEAFDRIGRSYGLLIDAEGAVQPRVARGDAVVGGRFRVEPPDASVRIETVEELVPSSTCSAFEVVYAGADERGVHLSVREYADPTRATPSKTRALLFPREAREIEVAGLRVRIDAVRPDGLICAVLEPEGGPAVGG